MGNGGMQPTYGPCTDNSFKTVGGNSTITNACECDAIPAQWEAMQVEISPLGEDDSHVMGAWGTGVADFGGS